MNAVICIKQNKTKKQKNKKTKKQNRAFGSKITLVKKKKKLNFNQNLKILYKLTMGQYYYVYNASKKQFATKNGKPQHYGKIGEFYIEDIVRDAIEEYDWDISDKIYILGDSSDYIKYEKFSISEDELEDAYDDMEYAIYVKYSENYNYDDVAREAFDSLQEQVYGESVDVAQEAFI
jgi:hypothetical protein